MPCPFLLNGRAKLTALLTNLLPIHKAKRQNIDLKISLTPGQPQVIRQIKPKATKHFDDDLAAFERDEETCSNQQPILSQSEGRVKKRQFKPLPMAAYKPSKVAFEQNVPSAKDEFKPLPKVFGMGPTVEAKVIFYLFFLHLIDIYLHTLFSLKNCITVFP